MRRIATFLGRLALAATLLVAAPAAAGEATDLVRAKQNAALELLKSDTKASKARDARIAAVLMSLFDFDALARSTISDEEWGKRSAAEQKEFTTLLTKLIQRSMEKNLTKIASFKVDYLNESELDGVYKVKTRASKEGQGEPVEIDYSLRKINDRLAAVDVSMEGSSTVKNYRSQFRNILNKEGWSGLIGRMKKRLDAGG